MFNFTKINEGEGNENKEWNEHLEESVRHVENEHVAIIYSQEIEWLIEALDDNDCLQIHWKQIISFKLC